jgi:hypothetical protein
VLLENFSTDRDGGQRVDKVGQDIPLRVFFTPICERDDMVSYDSLEWSHFQRLDHILQVIEYPWILRGILEMAILVRPILHTQVTLNDSELSP